MDYFWLLYSRMQYFYQKIQNLWLNVTFDDECVNWCKSVKSGNKLCHQVLFLLLKDLAHVGYVSREWTYTVSHAPEEI